MKIFHHRRNTVSEILEVPQTDGVEIDLRSSNGEIILQHDPFLPGVHFKDWLKSWEGQHLILNIKEEGIELRILELLEIFKVQEYFFLDQSFPFMVKTLKMGNRNVAARVSDLESIETSLRIDSDWAWLDCFSGEWDFIQSAVPILHSAQKKVCLVSPELVRIDVDNELLDLQKIIRENDLVIDGICTKRKVDWVKS
jgi:hypothetical protein